LHKKDIDESLVYIILFHPYKDAIDVSDNDGCSGICGPPSQRKREIDDMLFALRTNPLLLESGIYFAKLSDLFFKESLQILFER